MTKILLCLLGASATIGAIAGAITRSWAVAGCTTGGVIVVAVVLAIAAWCWTWKDGFM